MNSVGGVLSQTSASAQQRVEPISVGVMERLAALLNRNAEAENYQDAIVRRAHGEEPMPPNQVEYGISATIGLHGMLDQLERQVEMREGMNQRLASYL